MLLVVSMSTALKARSFFASRPVMFLSAALALVLTMTAPAGEAEARGWGRHHHGWFGGGFRAWFFAPPIWFHYQRYEAPPPPPPVYAPPPPPVYAPPPPPAYAYPYTPPPAYAPPPPPVAPQVYAYPQRDRPSIGLAFAGLVEAPQTGQLPMGGVAAGLQFRTGSHSLLSMELQSLGAHRLSDDTRRSDLAGIVSGRLFLWNAGLAPYLELGGGLGRAAVRANQLEVEAVQMVGRIGLGLELRLGEHLVLDGQIAQTHRLAFDQTAADAIEDHERATLFRGGVTLRF